ncbi:MAG: 30S ribosomal protein S9 [Candidatus Moranbacteria bacterium]|nr:30S ribosomal protein S9 [Candidatus Moranbacteria bacterium]
MPVKKSAKKELKKEPEKAKSAEKYFRGIGRRKLSIAGAKIFLASANETNQEFLINKKDYKEYFPLAELQDIVVAPLKAVASPKISRITVAVRGGGMRGQAEASRLGIARALVLIDETFKKPLRDLGYLTRDARIVERKKAGLKKARRAPQFSKR